MDMWQDELLEKKKQGELKVEGAVDVLTMALETPDTHGRVRAVGGNVNPTTYFNIPRKPRELVSKNELAAMLEKEREMCKMLLERIEKLEARENEKGVLTPKTLPGHGSVSDKASCQDEGKCKAAVVELERKEAVHKDVIADCTVKVLV